MTIFRRIDSLFPFVFSILLIFAMSTCSSLEDGGGSSSSSDEPERQARDARSDDRYDDAQLDGGTSDVDNPDGGTTDGANPDEPFDPGSCGPGRVEGRVCAPDTQTWLGGARVMITGSDCDGVEFEYETISDSDGYFTFETIPAGEHTLEVSMGSFFADYLVRVFEGETTNMSRGEEKVCLDDEGVRIAVVGGTYDSIESILDALAVDNEVYSNEMTGYYYSDPTPAEDFLLNPTLMAEYDIIMINCGEHYLYWGYDWYSYDYYDDAPSEKVLQMASNVRTFVDGGGSLYVSDLAYWAIELAYPEALEFADDESSYANASRGAITTTVARVVDSGLEMALGQSSVTIDFPLQGWVVAQDMAPYAHALLEGDAHLLDGSTISSAPLLVSFQPSETAGTVFFTSFHNESQLEEDIERILHYVIFSL